jgi:hypothetical protein
VTSGEPDPRTVERLLRSLPEWFGIESSLVEYVAAARRMPAYLAWPARSTGQDQDKDQGQERHPVGALLAPRPAGRICGDRRGPARCRHRRYRAAGW